MSQLIRNSQNEVKPITTMTTTTQSPTIIGEKNGG
jgi:hypothetical protein